MATIEVESKIPTWSVATPLMERVICPLCSHLHPAGMYGCSLHIRCDCCKIDVNRYGDGSDKYAE